MNEDKDLYGNKLDKEETKNIFQRWLIKIFAGKVLNKKEIDNLKLPKEFYND